MPTVPSEGRANPSPQTPPPRYTAVASDFHLSDVEAPDPSRPGWRRFKQADLRSDDRLVAWLDHLRALADGATVELILNGDIFDFDTIIAVPEPAPFPISWLERRRGLAPEEPKSAWKFDRILAAHPTFVSALQRWLADGNTVVFVIGNHDLELHWPAVQARLAAALAPPDPAQVTVCGFFRMSGDDTLVAHGNQLDAYCVCQDPVHPFIDIGGTPRVRSPFGNLAGKLMLNGMGYFNPHVESSFIRPLREYITFFFRYIARYQPLLVVSWLWSSVATLWVSLDEGFRPALQDPLKLEDSVVEAAARARSTPAVVRALRAVAVHPAVYSPFRVARELWLDRAALLLVLFAVVFQVGSALHWVSGVGPWALAILFLVLMPFYVMYVRSCRSEVGNTEANIRARLPALARIAGVQRVVMGHTHRAGARRADGVQYMNTGHWSAAFDDVECKQPVGTNGFAWIAPGAVGREAELRAFDGTSSRVLSAEPEAMAPILIAGSGVAA